MCSMKLYSTIWNLSKETIVLLRKKKTTGSRRGKV